ncbi:glycosyltransferase [Nonlabens dokdonensis]|uniref:Glycosyltransferase n=1 Tax=Nonlabens dokdonensis TaxID=328515 RepID=A0A1Z8B860_9FLAO|nr:glycosyltransferase family 2 protein [Nonlabens dokdonensis]OUS18688.1 glycosyltransferase [Nonlabens dokdonensis]
MKISIITINYNDAVGLERTIKSVQDQHTVPFEHLIIDGGSTDGSNEVIAKNSNYFSFTISEPDRGVYDAMNKGIKNATGDYLLFLNSGDVLFDSEVIEKVTPHLRSAHDLIYGDLYMVATDRPSFTHTYPTSLDFTFFKHTSLGHPSTFIKRELFNVHGFYRTDLKIVADWAFFLKVICIEKATYKKIDVTISRFYEGGISTAAATAQLNKDEINKVLLENFNLYETSYNQLIEENKNRALVYDKLHPQIGLLTTNKMLLRILNGFIMILSTLLKAKRSL